MPHKRVLRPSTSAINKIPRRGSDVPIFGEDDKESVGQKIQALYNEAVSLLSYQPIGLPLPISQADEEYKLLLAHLKSLKEKKEQFSDTWKNNYEKYSGREYKDSDPSDYSWSTNLALAQSEEMKQATIKYFESANEIKVELEKLVDRIKKKIDPAALLIISSEGMSKFGAKEVEYFLVVAQRTIDNILEEEWKKVQHFSEYKRDGVVTYIGSLNSGHKCVTKAFVQFNQKDFDVDGQFKHSGLYKALAKIKELPASKNRFFVRKIALPLKLHVTEKIKAAVGVQSARLNGLIENERAIANLLLFVDRVELRLVRELEGIIPDPNDKFDLAIVE